MKNVLNKRYFREFKSDFYKYAVIFFILIFMIGEGSGFFVADDSMIIGYGESFSKYKIEDGNFKTYEPLNSTDVEKIEKLGVALHENFSKDMKVITFPSGKPKGGETDNTLKLRIFKNRDEINLACLMEGDFPKKRGEIALDRTVAVNKGLKIGDRLKEEDGKKVFLITGLISLPDYTAMFESNKDMMFDASAFGVGVVGEEEFDTFKEGLKYTYSYHYNEAPLNKEEEKDRGDALVKKLIQIVVLEEFVPAYLNQGIQFVGEDFEGDRAMLRIFLYAVLAIMAFVFAITINNTISKEAEVIGTLLSLGYKKREIIRHYMFLPCLVTVISALIGNFLGYTILKDLNFSLYYASYSLPLYETRWSLTAFLETTVSSLVIMLTITYVSIAWKMRLSPLKFLTHDLRQGRKKRGMKLPPGMTFFTRFRLRVIFQNMGNYLMLFVGVLFAYFLLMFGLVFPVMMERFETNLKENMLAQYQYILNITPNMANNSLLLSSLGTDEEGAEAFGLKTLETDGSEGRTEDILVYGVKEGSSYVEGELGKNDVIISKMMADKYNLNPGDEFRLKEKYEENYYLFKITEVNSYEGGLNVFLQKERWNEMFGFEKEYFSGYFTNNEIKDIEKKWIATILNYETLTKMTRQMKVSMGKLMNIINFFAVLIFAMLIFLLTKTIIEKNTTSISMAKIMGYRNSEIRKLYVGATSFMMVGFLILGIPLIEYSMREVFLLMFRTRLKGWIPMHITGKEEATMFLLGFFTYLLVSLMEYRRIRKIRMDEVLKAVE